MTTTKETKEFQIALIHRGADAKNCAKWLANRLGICIPTARSMINDTSKITIGTIRTLKLSDEEMKKIIGI